MKMTTQNGMDCSFILEMCPWGFFSIFKKLGFLKAEDDIEILMWNIIWQGSRMRLGVTAKVRRIWKWSNGVKISEMGTFWCISITNNVESCKKFNGKAQTANSYNSCKSFPSGISSVNKDSKRPVRWCFWRYHPHQVLNVGIKFDVIWYVLFAFDKAW